MYATSCLCTSAGATIGSESNHGAHREGGGGEMERVIVCAHF